MRKRLIIFIGLLAAVGLIAAKGTQVFAPFFDVAGSLTADTITANTMAITTITGTNMTLTGTVSADSLSSTTVTATDSVVSSGGVSADSLYTTKLSVNATVPPTVEAKIGDGDDAGDAARLLVADDGAGKIIIGNESLVANKKYWTWGMYQDDMFLGRANDSYSPIAFNIYIKREDKIVIGDNTPADSTFNVSGGAKVTGGLTVAYAIDSADSVVAADRIKAGDNMTYSYFDPGDAGLTQSSSRKIKDLKGLVSVNVSDFMSVPVYRWKYKKEYSNSNKEHYGAVAEDFQRIYGNGKTINYEKAFWYLWAIVQEQQREIYAIKNSSGSILNDTFRDSHSRE